MEFRKLKADEIECRISTCSEKGVALLLYKDARVDQNILDESVGMMNWKRSHQLIGDRLYCTVSIYNAERGEWVDKQDVGTESYTEKEKGQASDSFKRACFNWGIGRELYTAPFIWVSAQDCNVTKRGVKYTCYDSFDVKDIAYTDNKISALTIINTKTHKVVYSMGRKSDTAREANLKVLTDKIAGREDVKAKVLSLCKKEKIEEISDRQIANILQHWDKVEAA